MPSSTVRPASAASWSSTEMPSPTTTASASRVEPQVDPGVVGRAALDATSAGQLDPRLLEGPLERRRDRLGEHRAAEHVVGEDQRHAGVVLHEGRGELGADVAAPHDDDVPAAARERAQSAVVLGGPEGHDAVVVRQVERGGAAARGEQQGAVADDVAGAGGHGAGVAVDRLDERAQPDLGTRVGDGAEVVVGLGVVGVGPELLGQRRTRVGRVDVGADDQHRGVGRGLVDGLRGGVGGHAAAHDDVVERVGHGVVLSTREGTAREARVARSRTVPS
jgi:hypothetical protein